MEIVGDSNSHGVYFDGHIYARNKVVSVANPLGNINTYGYDKVGNNISQNQSAGETYIRFLLLNCENSGSTENPLGYRTTSVFDAAISLSGIGMSSWCPIVDCI